MDDARDIPRTAIAVAFFIFGCAVYLAVTVQVVLEFWEPVVATVGSGPVLATMALAGAFAGACAIRCLVRLVNQWDLN